MIDSCRFPEIFKNPKKNVLTDVVKLKGSEERDRRTLVEISDSCIKHGFTMRLFLIVFSLST
jgi:hypothetical protein